MDSVNRWVEGRVTMRLYKGQVIPIKRNSPYALYDAGMAGFGESGGSFSQQASPGFIELFTLQTRLAHRVRDGKGEE
jgi:argininosuccinate synthase